jgi:hypothetical protein
LYLTILRQSKEWYFTPQTPIIYGLMGYLIIGKYADVQVRIGPSETPLPREKRHRIQEKRQKQENRKKTEEKKIRSAR